MSQPKNILVTPQPPPHQNGEQSAADSVIKDMIDRKAWGVAKYGVPLQSNNGRNNLIDAYQESLDMCVYLRCEIDTNWTDPNDLW